MNPSISGQSHGDSGGGSLAPLFYSTGLFVLGGFVLWIGRGIFVPLVISAFLSFLIVTVKRQIQRIPKIGSALPETMLFILAFAMIVLVLLILVAIVRNNIGAVVSAAPSYTEQLTLIWNDLVRRAVDLPFREELQTSLTDLRNNAVDAVTSVLGDAAAIATGLLGGLTTVILYTAFMLLERGRYLKKVAKIAGPRDRHGIVADVLDDIARLTREYISVKTSTSFLTGAISWAIMLALGIDFAGFWALVIFALNYIPVIGSIIGVILPTVLALVQPGGGVTLFLVAGVLLTGAQQLVGSFIEPRMMGRSLNLSPLVILLSLATWGSVWGIAGMFLCVPITVVLMIILAQFSSTRPVAILLSANGEVGPLEKGILPKGKAAQKANVAPDAPSA